MGEHADGSIRHVPGVAGTLQREGEGEHPVVHPIAKRLFDHSELLGELVTASRDFC